MPTRYLKAGVRDSEVIDQLSTLAETFFYRLLVTVDDFGRYDARASMIKAQCYPIKESVTAKKCAELLKELSDAGMIEIYTVDEKEYLQVCRWDNVPRAKESKFPQKPDNAKHLHTHVYIPRTDAPLTVTVTETKTETKTVGSAYADLLTDVPKQIVDDWTTLRKSKKAPVTRTVVEGAIAEAGKAGMTLTDFLAEWCSRGSQGLKAEWLADKRTASNYEPPYAKYMREKMEQISPSIAAKKPNSEARRIDPNEFLRTIEAQNVVRIN